MAPAAPATSLAPRATSPAGPGAPATLPPAAATALAPVVPPTAGPAATLAVPTATPPTGPALPTPVLTTAEQQYVTALRGQLARWQTALAALNGQLQTIQPGNAAWLKRTGEIGGQMQQLAGEAAALRAPPRLAAIDVQYKAGAGHYNQATQVFGQWYAAHSAQSAQQFNSEMRQGSAQLREAARLLDVFMTGGRLPVVVPPAPANAAPTPPAKPTAGPAAPPSGKPTPTPGGNSAARPDSGLEAQR